MITVELVRRLIAAQFPQWANLPITPAEPQGWDNRTFRLGEHMSVRLPSGEGYTSQVEKEHRWLPFLAPQLPLPIPVPIAAGRPGEGYPFPWSVYRWLDGDAASVERIADLSKFATQLGQFLRALQRIDATGGPLPGIHTAFRGGPLATYDAETRRAVVLLGEEIDADAVTRAWQASLGAVPQSPSVWFHGDMAVGNLLVKDGHLCAVIDFGCAGVGDPACDTVIAWTLFEGKSRQAFRTALPLDAATWVRGRGWALWKALISLAEYKNTNASKAQEARWVINEILSDHGRDVT